MALDDLNKKQQSGYLAGSVHAVFNEPLDCHSIHSLEVKLTKQAAIRFTFRLPLFLKLIFMQYHLDWCCYFTSNAPHSTFPPHLPQIKFASHISYALFSHWQSWPMAKRVISETGTSWYLQSTPAEEGRISCALRRVRFTSGALYYYATLSSNAHRIFIMHVRN